MRIIRRKNEDLIIIDPFMMSTVFRRDQDFFLDRYTPGAEWIERGKSKQILAKPVKIDLQREVDGKPMYLDRAYILYNLSQENRTIKTVFVPDDEYVFGCIKSDKKSRVVTSNYLYELWGNGNCVFGKYLLETTSNMLKRFLIREKHYNILSGVETFYN